MKGLLVLATILIHLFGNSAFTDYVDGEAAYSKKDYATALKEWKPLANQGDARAQTFLGLIYEHG